VQCILQAFREPGLPESEDGVGRPAAGQPVLEFLVRALRAERVEAVEGARCEAATKVLELVSSQAVGGPRD
jgi:hypothetical protein